jgi:two-component system CheB/CheR fusion protein
MAAKWGDETSSNETEPAVRTPKQERSRAHKHGREGEMRGLAAAMVVAVRTPLVLLDAERRVVAANEAFLRIFETEPAATVGHASGTAATRWLDTPALQAIIDRAAGADAASDNNSIAIALPNGHVSTFTVTAARIENQALAAILIALQDVSAPGGAGQAMMEAGEASEHAHLTKSRFVAAASHDLRQPLQTLSLLHANLREHLANQEALATLASAQRTCESMKNIVNMLLDLDQLERGAVRPNLTEFPLHEIFDMLDGEFGALAEAKGLGWRRVGSGLFVRSDRLLLENMVRNLLSNAVRYTDRGRILLGRRRRGDRLRIEVWDTGLGIADEQVPRIFDEYHRAAEPARPGGLGLGLAIVKSFGALLGHAIEVRSRVGKGSVFAIEVPLVDRPAVRGNAPAGARRKRSAHRAPTTMTEPFAPAERDARPIVAIVDDDRDTRSATQLLLVRAGYRVRVFADAQAFLDAHRTGDTGCLIVDVRMPGMSGLEMLARLAAAGAALPTIIVSGQADISMAVEAMRAGAIDFIEKPIVPETLLAAADRALRRALGPAERGTAGAAAGLRLAALTKRERDVMMLIVAGFANKEVAGRLGINRRTVEAHRATIMKKMGARSLSDLVRLEIAAHAGA